MKLKDNLEIKNAYLVMLEQEIAKLEALIENLTKRIEYLERRINGI